MARKATPRLLTLWLVGILSLVAALTIAVPAVIATCTGGGGEEGGKISVSPSSLKFKTTGSQNVTVTFSGSGSVGVGPITVTDLTHFALNGEEACEYTYSSSKPKCTFQVELYKYAKPLSALVHIETGVGHLQVSLSTE